MFLAATEPSYRLRQAIIEDNLSIALRLLKRFPNLITNIDSSNGWTNLHYASYYGHYLIASNLIKLIDIYDIDKEEVKLTFKKETYLHLCVSNEKESEQTMHLLLQNFGTKLIDYTQYQGKAAIHICCELNYHLCLQLLIDFGADLNIQDNEGNTALHLAMEMGNVKCVKILLSQADSLKKDLKNNSDFTCKEVANSFDTIKFYDFCEKNVEQQQSQLQSIADHTAGGNSSNSSILMSTNNSNVLNSARSHHSYSVSSSLPPLPSVTTTNRWNRAGSVTSTTSSPGAKNLPANGILASIVPGQDSQATASNESTSSVNSSSSPSISSSSVNYSLQSVPLGSGSQLPVTPFMTTVTPIGRSRSASMRSDHSPGNRNNGKNHNGNIGMGINSGTNINDPTTSPGQYTTNNTSRIKLLPAIPKLVRNSVPSRESFNDTISNEAIGNEAAQLQNVEEENPREHDDKEDMIDSRSNSILIKKLVMNGNDKERRNGEIGGSRDSADNIGAGHTNGSENNGLLKIAIRGKNRS